MAVFISILRGINVGGQKKIRMEDLKKVFEVLGFTEVTTYIQSGNVIFKTNLEFSVSGISEKIEKAIEGKYNFNVPVIIRTADEMNHILLSNPFLKEKETDLEKLHVTFLEAIPDPEEVIKTEKIEFPVDSFRIIGKDVYLYCPGGYGNTKLSNVFFENKLKVKATTRNWRTVGILAELASH